MEFVSGNLYIRPMMFERAGDLITGHHHNFDHTTYVVRGAVLIEQLDDDERVIRSVEKRADTGQNWVLIKAKAIHRITALEDATIAHCIFAHRTPQGEITQEYDGWQSAYA